MKVICYREALLVCAWLLMGCSSGGDEWADKLPDTVPAEGVVTFDGKPVEGATVILAPVAPGKFAATAITDSSGWFQLRAFPSKEGAVPGAYQVGVSKKIEKGAAARKPRNLGADAAHADRLPPPTEWNSLLPEQYADPTKSGLTMEIPPEGNSELKIDLKSKS